MNIWKQSLLDEPSLVLRDTVASMSVLCGLAVESNVVDDGRLMKILMRHMTKFLFDSHTHAVRQNCSSTPAWLTKKVRQERNCMVTTEALAGMVNNAPVHGVKTDV